MGVAAILIDSPRAETLGGSLVQSRAHTVPARTLWSWHLRKSVLVQVQASLSVPFAMGYSDRASTSVARWWDRARAKQTDSAGRHKESGGQGVSVYHHGCIDPKVSQGGPSET